MKISLDDFWGSIKTKVEPSISVKGLWIARTVIGVKINDVLQPIFGFAASFDREQSITRSAYELLEHIVFLPYFHTKESADKLVTYQHEDFQTTAQVKDYLIGSSGFYGNGCAISSDKQFAINHSKRELLERHICCDIWYKRRSIKEEYFNFEKIIDPAINIKFYTTDVESNDKFIIAVLDCNEMWFFAIGSAIKATVQDAILHAATEAIMLLEDAKKGRNGHSHTDLSKQQILSLRDKALSERRKNHFEKILQRKKILNDFCELPRCQTIIFEPFGNMFAARTICREALDPRSFVDTSETPVLPLF